MKVFFQKNSEKEKHFKCYINVKKKTFKRAVDRNKIKRRMRVIMKNIILEKNKKIFQSPERFVNKKKIMVLYDFEIEDLTIDFKVLQNKVYKLISCF